MTIFSNDPNYPQFPISLTGDVMELLEARPLAPKLQGLVGTPLTTTFTLREGSWLGIEVLSHETRLGNARIEKFEAVGDGGEFQVILAADPVDRPAVYREELVVKVRTEDGKEREVSFRIQVEHNPRVVLEPRGNIKFLANHLQSLRQEKPVPVSRAITLRPGGEGVTFQVLEVRLDEKLQGIFRTDIQPVNNGSSYRVMIHIDEWHDVPQVLGRLTIITDDPENPENSIWVMAHFGNPTDQPALTKPSPPKAPPGGAQKDAEKEDGR